MKVTQLLLSITAAVFSTSLLAADITGAGATYPYPIYAKWAVAYQKETGVKVNYQSIGSGGGIKQIMAKTVDFGASDKPLGIEELQKAGLIQFPAVIGAIVPIVNLPEVPKGALLLNGSVLADIYLKKITKWNDPAIKVLNPHLTLPEKGIVVVYRSDGSGTTYNFANYLGKVSKEWKDKVGADTSISWPTGVGGKGNEGVASYVNQIKFSIGYVEFAYALQNGMSYANMQNSTGNAVKPGITAFQAAAKYAKWDKSNQFNEVLTNQPGQESWPIVAATFILMHKNQSDLQKAKNVLGFFNFGYTKGAKMAESLEYVPLPDNLVTLVQEHWKAEIKAAGNPVWQ